MFFLKPTLAKIWNAANRFEHGSKREGKLVTYKGEPAKIKPYDDLYKDAIQRLKDAGFEVNRTSPLAANAIIRVYRNAGFFYDGVTYWGQGVDLFARNFGCMLSSYQTLIDYDYYGVKFWVFQDDSFVMPMDFVDYYVRIRECKH